MEPRELGFLGPAYWCRHVDCGWVGLGTDWIHNLAVGGSHYRCPRCLRRYRPWKTTKVCPEVREPLAIHHTLSGGAAPTGQAGHFCVHLCKWPVAPGIDLHEMLEEMRGAVDRDVRRGRTVAELNRLVLAVYKHVRIHRLEEHTLQDDGRDRIWELKQLNRHCDARKTPWSWQHLEAGFIGIHFHPVENKKMLSYEKFVRMWALFDYLAVLMGATLEQIEQQGRE